MSYDNYNSGTYESRIMKEVMIIISVIIIGICVLVYYINNNFGRSDIANSDTDSVYVETNAGSTEKSTQVASTENKERNTVNNTVKTDNKVSTTEISNSTVIEDKTEVVTVNKSLSIGKIEQSAHSVEGLKSNATSGAAADVIRYSGNIGAEDQEDWYSFTAPYEGRYRIDVSGIQSGTDVRLYLYDELGDVVTSDTYCTNGEGITGKGLEAGKTYSIKVKQDSGYSSYSLAIGMQKAPIDLTGYTAISDSIEFIDQRNVYYFSVPLTGRYRFNMSEIYSGTDVELYIFDSLGNTVASDTYCTNGDGITVRDLQAGAIYEIQVRQDNGFSGYKLSIGYQKSTVDISDYTIVNDSIEYTDQRNVYSFTVPVDGRYRFELSGMTGGTDVELYMFNYLEETVASDTYCTNGDGITVKDLKAGETYEVQIRQDNGFSSYTLFIGKQKETVDISDKISISDSVEFTDQRNVYSFTAKSSGDVTITISGLESGVVVEAYVFDDLDSTVVSDTYFTNGDSITIKGCSIGEHYEIQIRQDSGMSNYTLNIN